MVSAIEQNFHTVIDITKNKIQGEKKNNILRMSQWIKREALKLTK